MSKLASPLAKKRLFVLICFSRSLFGDNTMAYYRYWYFDKRSTTRCFLAYRAVRLSDLLVSWYVSTHSYTSQSFHRTPRMMIKSLQSHDGQHSYTLALMRLPMTGHYIWHWFPTISLLYTEVSSQWHYDLLLPSSSCLLASERNEALRADSRVSDVNQRQILDWRGYNCCICIEVWGVWHGVGEAQRVEE